MFDKVLQVNLRGMFLGLRFVLPHMVAAGKGAVVNTPRSARNAGSPAPAPTTPPSTARSASPAPPASEVRRRAYG
jgi:NAD(P)-dependent dehydrogenase (short-subunit alcohol dehydrogenase family)